MKMADPVQKRGQHINILELRLICHTTAKFLKDAGRFKNKL